MLHLNTDSFFLLLYDKLSVSQPRPYSFLNVLTAAALYCGTGKRRNHNSRECIHISDKEVLELLKK